MAQVSIGTMEHRDALSDIFYKMLEPDQSVFECRDERNQVYMITVQGWYDRGLPLGLHIERRGGEHFSRTYKLLKVSDESEFENRACILADCLLALQVPETFRATIRSLNRMARRNFCELIAENQDVEKRWEESSMGTARGEQNIYGRAGQERDWAKQLGLVQAQEVSIADVLLKAEQSLLLLSVGVDLRSASMTREMLAQLQSQGVLRCILVNPCGIASASLANLLYGQFVCLMHKQPFSLTIHREDQLQRALAA